MSDSLRTPRIAITGMWSNGIHGLRFDGSAVASAVLRSVIRAGGDTDTVGAVAGSLAALSVGCEGIDAGLVDGIADWPHSPRYLRQLGAAPM